MSAFDLLIMGFFFGIVLLSFLGGLDKVLSILVGLYSVRRQILLAPVRAG